MKPISLLKYPGGKTRAVHILEKFVPPGTTCIYSPFFGGGSFEIYCAQQKGIRVVGNDKFEPLVNFWQMVIADKECVCKEAAKLFPVTEDKFNTYKTRFIRLRNAMKRAAMFFTINKTSFNGQFRAFSSNHSPNAFDTIHQFNPINLDVGHSDFKDFFDTVPKSKKDVLVFVDPPYITNDYYYGWNGSLHRNFDHASLASILTKRSRNTCWMLCYNDCPQIRNMYNGFTIVEVAWWYSIRVKKRGKEKNTEIIILSHALSKRLEST
jgi:DNA adenine methylase